MDTSQSQPRPAKDPATAATATAQPRDQLMAHAMGARSPTSACDLAERLCERGGSHTSSQPTQRPHPPPTPPPLPLLLTRTSPALKKVCRPRRSEGEAVACGPRGGRGGRQRREDTTGSPHRQQRGVGAPAPQRTRRGCPAAGAARRAGRPGWRAPCHHLRLLAAQAAAAPWEHRAAACRRRCHAGYHPGRSRCRQ